MQMDWKQAILIGLGLAALGGAACPAQTSAAGQAQASPAPMAQARAEDGPQFTIGGSFYEAMNKSTTGNGTQQTTTNASGGMLEVRFIDRPLMGFEFTYSYNPANQSIEPTTTNCGYACANKIPSLTVKASEVGLDYVVSKRFGNLRPFAVGGIGFFISSPSNSLLEVQTVVRPAYIFGGGVDWAVMRHFGVRAQFRDNVYKAPDLSNFNPPTGQYTYTAEPMGGVYYNF
jgi:opacity protein-like surface antigen